MFYVLKPQSIKFGHMVIAQRIKDLATIFAAADQPQLT
jgi:hypothetical protein